MITIPKAKPRAIAAIPTHIAIHDYTYRIDFQSYSSSLISVEM